MNDKIKFEDPEAEDPDWKVKQAYTLMIAAALEIENGVENMWKRGPSGGRHDYPDFGKYMPINHFKVFKLQHHTAGARRNTGMLKSVIARGTYLDLAYSR
jgi:hypothetical protein